MPSEPAAAKVRVDVDGYPFTCRYCGQPVRRRSLDSPAWLQHTDKAGSWAAHWECHLARGAAVE